MKNLNPFQLAIVAVFLVLMMGGIAIFAVFGAKTSTQVGQVTVWGLVDRSIMETVLVDLVAEDQTFQQVTYVQKRPETYLNELTEAIAKGSAPDLVMLTESDIVGFANKVQLIPYSAVSQRTFIDSFIDQGAMFLTANGALGLPFLADPLVMYYNRDLFAGAGIASYPKTWTEVQSMAPRMTSLDGASNVKRSAVAMGTYDNVRHAKKILSMLLLQAGDRVSVRGEDGSLSSVFGTNQTQSAENPAEAVLRFYTSFANPTQTSYSWNRSLPNSFNAFTAGDLGVYFGLASEYAAIIERNPNLSVGAAVVPQTSAAKSPVTYGSIVVLSVPRAAANPTGGMIVAQHFTDARAIGIISQKTGLPPVRRDVIADTPADSIGSVFAQSALIARAWYDPSPQATETIFRDMVESVISGRARLSDAIQTAQLALFDLFESI